ncbi:hypothetical protein EHE19_018165 [Ruminiclostridium herbifermentans]|uniref:Uncharacterized protein n=2 Tax=Ruminiclostridium herbifermentans TaxID=2488810 RepID=A0A7H1VMX6_9FIRM|nr:hypothetical protein EHE19_018165 [Ruminiclostridium herbifermentans]
MSIDFESCRVKGKMHSVLQEIKRLGKGIVEVTKACTRKALYRLTDVKEWA